MRASDICFCDGCEKPHFRAFSHIVGNHRYYFHAESCQLAHIQAMRQRQFALRREELERRTYGEAHP